jgi:hypothetical protein
VNRRRFLQLLTGSAAGLALAPALDLSAVLAGPGKLLLPGEHRIIEPWLLEPGWITTELLRYLDRELADYPLVAHNVGPTRLGETVRMPYAVPVMLDQWRCINLQVAQADQCLLTREEFSERCVALAARALAENIRHHRLNVFAPLPLLPAHAGLWNGSQRSSDLRLPVRTAMHVRPDALVTELRFDILGGSSWPPSAGQIRSYASTRR